MHRLSTLSRILSAAPLILLLVGVEAAQAGVVYEQPVLNAFDRGPYSDMATPQEIADQFTLGATTIITDVHWSGSYDGADVPDGVTSLGFKIRLFNDAGGLPALAPFHEVDVAASVISSGVIFDGHPIYVIETELVALSLTGGTPIWIGIRENDPATTGLFRWANSNEAVGDYSAFRNGDGTPWSPESGNRGNHAFALTDDAAGASVPSPGGLVLLASGLAGLVALQRSRRQS